MKLRNSLRDLMMADLSCRDISTATLEKNSCTSSVDSTSLSGTRCCQYFLLLTNSVAQSGSHLVARRRGGCNGLECFERVDYLKCLEYFKYFNRFRVNVEGEFFIQSRHFNNLFICVCIYIYIYIYRYIYIYIYK